MLDQQGDLILVAKCSSIRGFVRPWVRRAFFQKLRIQAWTLVSENLLLNSANEEYAISKRDDTAAWLVHEVQLDRRFEQRCELDFSDVTSGIPSSGSPPSPRRTEVNNEILPKIFSSLTVSSSQRISSFRAQISESFIWTMILHPILDYDLFFSLFSHEPYHKTC